MSIKEKKELEQMFASNAVAVKQLFTKHHRGDNAFKRFGDKYIVRFRENGVWYHFGDGIVAFYDLFPAGGVVKTTVHDPVVIESDKDAVANTLKVYNNSDCPITRRYLVSTTSETSTTEDVGTSLEVDMVTRFGYKPSDATGGGYIEGEIGVHINKEWKKSSTVGKTDTTETENTIEVPPQTELSISYLKTTGKYSQKVEVEAEIDCRVWVWDGHNWDYAFKSMEEFEEIMFNVSTNNELHQKINFGRTPERNFGFLHSDIDPCVRRPTGKIVKVFEVDKATTGNILVKSKPMK